MPTGDDRSDVPQGALALMILRTLDTMGPQHGYGLARRMEQVSGDRIELNQGTFYPALVRLEQEGWIKSDWGVSENNRRAKFYTVTRSGRKRLSAENRRWVRVGGLIARFLRPADGGQ